MVAVLLVLAGLALLLAGGELLVRAASSVARLAGVSPAVVGLTVVAAGTSMPELVVSVRASLTGSAELAIGNVVGSNVFNVGAILGIAALIAPLRITGKTVRLEWPVMLASAVLFYLFARDGRVERLEGGFLLVALVLFVAYTVRIARHAVGEAEAREFADAVHTLPALSSGRRGGWASGLLGVVAGCSLLAGGAHMLVAGATDLARSAGISETVIGLTVVAAGTSLPELATSAVASLRGQDDVAVTNVIGSNIFNVLGIVGATAAFGTVAVPADILARDVWWMLGSSVLLLPLLRSGFRVTRLEGLGLLLAYLVYTAFLVLA